MSFRTLSALSTLTTRCVTGTSRHLPAGGPAFSRTMATAILGRKAFDFPHGTRYKITSSDQGLSQRPAFASALRNHGILSIDMHFHDPESNFILDLISAMGCKAQTHSAKDGALWDITWKPEGSAKDPSGQASKDVWSHSMDEMSWHTDGSFERHPMPFFGFHILRSDHEGGGQFRVLRADEIARKLTPDTWNVLTTREYDLKVPSEFQKDVTTVRGKIIEVEPHTGTVYLRYRSSVIMDPPAGDNEEANKAVEELQSLLHDDPLNIGETIAPEVFNDNSILLMDNARYLHSRTDVKDEKRFLRRVRFQGVPN